MAWIELGDFRSYGALRWEPAPGVNVLVARNGAGKTNLLEAIGYLSSLRSFRKVPDRILIRMGADRAVVRGEVVTERGSTLIEVELPSVGRRRAQVNRGRLGRLADLLGKVRSVIFLPDDLDLVKRGPAHRRDLLDTIAVQLWPGAYGDQRDYERALRQRNMLLKQMGRRADPVSLEVWDERMAAAGARVMARRYAAVAAVEPEASSFYGKLSGGKTRLTVAYRSGWGARRVGDLSAWEECLREALQAARPKDLERRVSTVGPHRDDVVLLLDDRDARLRASQGEQRTLTLALRLAAHRAVQATVSDEPLLLLDDVFSELDRHRARALARFLPDAQTFITTAREDDVPVEGRKWLLTGGVWR